MAKPTMKITMAALFVWGASICWAAQDKSAAEIPAHPAGEPALATPFETGPSQDAPAADGTDAQVKAPNASSPDAGASPAEAKSLLGEAFIVQNHLQVYLDRPASISVYNARGQQIFHVESRASMESVPLMGVNTGFLYLTVRAGQTELTKKLVYTGK